MKRYHYFLIALCILPFIFLKFSALTLWLTDSRPDFEQQSMTSLAEGEQTQLDVTDSAITFIGDNDTHQFGVSENTVYASRLTAEGSGPRAPWKYFVTLPFAIKDPYRLSYLPPDQLLYQASDDSLCYYHSKTKTIEVTSFPAMLARLKTNDITSITFRRGSSGCFHHYEQEIIYTLQSDDYQLKEQTSHGSEHGPALHASTRKIDGAAVRAFADHIIHFYPKRATVNDLGLSAADLATCKKNIWDFQRRKQKGEAEYFRDVDTTFSIREENVDFDRLVTLVDRIAIMDSLTLETALQEQANRDISTTSYWVKIELQDKQNNVLEITHRYYHASPFCVPWQLTMRGAKKESMDLAITRFIQTYCPALIPSNNKVPFLHTLVKQMYE